MSFRVSSLSSFFLLSLLFILHSQHTVAFLTPTPNQPMGLSLRSPSSSSFVSSPSQSNILSPLSSTHISPKIDGYRKEQNISRRLIPLYGLFGLGTPEIVVICVVAGVVLGPDKLVDLARGFGKAAGELKAVPQEFEKGLNEGKTDNKKAKKEMKAMKTSETSEGMNEQSRKEKEVQMEE